MTVLTTLSKDPAPPGVLLETVPIDPPDTGTKLVSTLGWNNLIDLLEGTSADEIALSALETENFLSFDDIAQPAIPSTGLRLYAENMNGFSNFKMIDSTGLTFSMVEDQTLFVRNKSGMTLTKGQIVHITGATGNIVEVGLAKADSDDTVPAIGMLTADVADNAFCRPLIVGSLSGVDTQGFAEGDTIFVSATVAGAFTNVRPSHPAEQQNVGHVTSVGPNGSIQIFITSLNGKEEGTHLNTFKIGDALAGTKTLEFKNASIGSLQWNPSAARTLTLPDLSGTLSIDGHTHLEADITDLQNYSLVGHTHVEADITDLQAYLLNINSESVGALSDVTVTAPLTRHGLMHNGAGQFVNRLLVEADISDLQSYLLDITGENFETLADIPVHANGDQILRRNVGNTAFEWIDISSLPTAGITSINGDTTPAQILAGTTNRISLVDAGDTHTFDIDAAYVGQASITTLGTINTGVWNGTPITGAFIDIASTDLSDSASLARSSDDLSFFAATTSLQLANLISDETGSGALVFGTSPIIVTPTIADFTNAIHNHEDVAGGGQINSTLALSDTVDIAYLNTENMFGIGQKQSVRHDTNQAGLRVIPSAGNPLTPQDGDIWINGTEQKLFTIIDSIDTLLSTNITTINFVIDGGGSAITTGIKGHVIVDFNCTVIEWAILGLPAGAIVVDVRRSTFAGFPTTASIAGTELPTITATNDTGEDRTLNSWNSIIAGDALEFVVNSVTTIERCTVALKCRMT